MSNVVFFDGVDDYVNCGNGVSLQITGPFTMAARFKLIKLDLGGCACGKATGAVPTGGYIIYLYASAGVWQWSCWITDGAGVDELRTNKTTWDINMWHQVAATYENAVNGFKIYVDGQLDKQKTPAIVSIGNNAIPFRCGTFDTIQILRGYEAEVQVYNRVLNPTEILYNFLHPSNPIRRGIQLNLTQDSIQGAQWLDLSGNNNHGTYVGGALPMTANLLAGR